VPSKLGELNAPFWLELESNSGAEYDCGRELGGGILLERVVLQAQVAKELGVLLDVFRNLLDQAPLLPRVVGEGNSYREEVAHHVEGSDGSELPVKVAEDRALPISEGKAIVGLRQLGDD